jgi:hypothetical protein
MVKKKNNELDKKQQALIYITALFIIVAMILFILKVLGVF